MKRYQKFLGFWLINSAILYLANLFLPNAVSIGNSIFAPYQAIVFSGFIWNLVLWHTEAFLKDLEYPYKENVPMMLAYLVMNFATVWLIARFAFITGVGIASYLYVAGIAVIANFVQYKAWQYMDKRK
ncbi:hypothetical protein A3A52_05115 [Candidatus Woesebacteria bacterium RIFCSPLOWO2_01_FULL_39_14]|uniref:Uncharacterized protein n=1 Tax=Candidatus Woesebacteria bacterium RIFCSPLOWO2_01_FULL_39_14 TaxID=1802518 RepID=A0A1F8BHI8_9BACT|nr:MAG: hypothetical protein A3A52_05115 [Candidatus Woesebacteria bacterium RIFCSPLOWO2_01_FULL_39_14]